MEEFSKNCGFILTCNFRNRIIDPLISRCSVVEFNIPKKESPQVASQFFNRIIEILDSENVKYNKNAVAALVTKHFPDFRRALNELQRYSAVGKIDSGILSLGNDESVKELISFLKDKNFSAVRKWVGENSDIESSVLFRKLYDTAADYLKPSAVPQLVLIIADYQYKSAFVADNEINMVACLTEIMVECEFK
jgi:DNA polymerase III delta prime subunit